MLSDVAGGAVTPADALTRIQTAPTADLGFAQLDLSRGVRQGAGEVVYGAGKTADQIVAIIEALRDAGQERILVTRLDAEKAARMDRLLKLQDSIAFPMIAAMAGQTVKVLVEAAGRTPGTLNGRLDNNLVVEFPAEETLIGQYANVRLTGSRAALLVGELAE